MDTIQNVLAVIVVLGLLITFHEFGHFWVARRCGVKVLRFSVGFGKPLWSRFDRQGTEYAIAAIPLGGYVKMLDEREGPVAPEELGQAFNRKSVWARIAIVAAGPIANFLLALVAYWALFVYGSTTVAPVIGDVAPDSLAFQGGLRSGQEIVSVEGHETPSWNEVNLQLIAAIGAGAVVVLGLAVLAAYANRTTPGDEIAPGAVGIVCGLALVAGGVALVVYVMRTLLAQAVALDDETKRLQAELDGVI